MCVNFNFNTFFLMFWKTIETKNLFFWCHKLFVLLSELSKWPTQNMAATSYWKTENKIWKLSTHFIFFVRSIYEPIVLKFILTGYSIGICAHFHTPPSFWSSLSSIFTLKNNTHIFIRNKKKKKNNLPHAHYDDKITDK